MTLTSTIILGIATSLIASIIYGTVGGGYRRFLGKKINIIEPQGNGFFPAAERRNGVVAHRVSGTLMFVPKGQKLWLLVVDEQKGRCWPQGFEAVEHDEKTGLWKGYVHIWGWNTVKVAAVLAPPTSQDFFNYYQRVGAKTDYEAIVAIPEECKQRCYVVAKVPPVTAA